MKHRIFLFFLAVLTAGCATTFRYEAKLNTWIGQSEDSLVSFWGVPDKVYQMTDGKKAIAYLHKSTVQTGGYTYTEPQTTYQSGKIGDQSYSGTSTTYVTETKPVEKYRIYCKTSFIIDENAKVVSWHHEGNNCVSK